MRVEDARTDTIFKQTGGERTMSSGAGDDEEKNEQEISFF